MSTIFNTGRINALVYVESEDLTSQLLQRGGHQGEDEFGGDYVIFDNIETQYLQDYVFNSQFLFLEARPEENTLVFAEPFIL